MLGTYFASRGARVTAADRDRDSFVADLPFVPIGRELPFAAESFDIVIFNHVIEHVGTVAEQAAMLAQIARILRPGGKLYLAAPTKWALIEPHFRLPLLGALPRSIADAWVRAAGKGTHYDCFPLGRTEMLHMLEKNFSQTEDVSLKAFEWMRRHEDTRLRFVPAISAAFPTAIFIARK